MRDAPPKMMTEPALWYRIRGAMLPVERDGRSFREQLSEITGLGGDAARALEIEYRRFLYLASVTAAPREPLGLLRTAWEHHASFDGYLSDFCPWVLECHLPVRPVSKVTGPAYAAAWFDYAGEFGAPPPKQIWPAPETRMSLSDVRALAASGVPAVQG